MRIFFVFIFLTFLVMVVPGTAWTEPELTQEEKMEAWEKLAEDGVYGKESACGTCHKDEKESYEETAHADEENEGSPATKKGCQSCHGPGEGHIQSKGEVSTAEIGAESESSVEEKSKVCLDCHNKEFQAGWKGSVHQKEGKACIDCHDVHNGKDKLLKGESVAEGCFACHDKVKPDFMTLSHHPVLDGKVSCAQCHKLHESTAPELASGGSYNKKCINCHEKQGAFFKFGHKPVGENCLNCHKGHGSTFNTLFTLPMPYLCHDCHPKSHKQGLYHLCDNCHRHSHGSSHPMGKTFLQ
ncbi:cytochrome c3 family protein [Candidatus Riflebacteria bacterium]